VTTTGELVKLICKVRVKVVGRLYGVDKLEDCSSDDGMERQCLEGSKNRLREAVDIPINISISYGA
jgi:hypothetical protein